MRNHGEQHFGEDSDGHLGEGAPLIHANTEGDDKEDIESLHQYLDSLPEQE
jgi:hypothetical protein